eukprot:scaffold97565_cov44-Prasinocladus_malaysianus.AAC.2
MVLLWLGSHVVILLSPDQAVPHGLTSSFSANGQQTSVQHLIALCQPYITQLVLIYGDMLNIYKMYSELISNSIVTGGPHASKTSIVKLMRSVKKVRLRMLLICCDNKYIRHGCSDSGIN